MSRLDVGYEDLDRSLGFGGTVAVGLTVILLSAFALLATTFEGQESGSPVHIAERADVAATSSPAVTELAAESRVIVYIVGSDAAARELEAGLAPFDLSEISILVAETPERGQAWRISLDMAAWEDVLVEVHDLTLD
jgi:hypothetical protein